eukprot:3974236-Pyramimonas_sp.AAC.1
MSTRPLPAFHQRSHGFQSSHACAGLVLRDSEWSGAEDLPRIPHHPEMSRRPTSRNTAARERQAARRQPRTSTDLAPLCRIGSNMVSCPQRSGPLCDG